MKYLLIICLVICASNAFGQCYPFIPPTYQAPRYFTYSPMPGIINIGNSYTFNRPVYDTKSYYNYPSINRPYRYPYIYRQYSLPAMNSRLYHYFTTPGGFHSGQYMSLGSTL